MSLTARQLNALHGLDADVAAMLAEPSSVIKYLDAIIDMARNKPGTSTPEATCGFILRIIQVHTTCDPSERLWASPAAEQEFCEYVVALEGDLTTEKIIATALSRYGEHAVAQIKTALDNPQFLEFLQSIVEIR